MNIISKNLKKFRLQKNLTQEQAADALGVNPQTISRCECSITLPDVTKLPEIARLYCVTVDDMFKDTSAVYENYAQRLACIYHKTRDPEDFFRADIEFQQLQKNNNYSFEDMRMHGMIHHYMMWYCKEKAVSIYKNIINNCAEIESDTYRQTRLAIINLYILLGRAEDCINEQKELFENTKDMHECYYLLRALCFAEQCEEAYEFLKIAKDIFPSWWAIYSVGGDICRKLKKYEEAFENWDKSLELDNTHIDAMRAKANCYEELKDYKNAYETRCEMILKLRADGYEIEAQTEEERAQNCLNML